MEDRVYVYQTKENNLLQVKFLNFHQIGIAYGKKSFIVKAITFTFVDPKTIFPTCSNNTYLSERELLDLTPVLISYDEKDLNEDGPLFTFYQQKSKQCDIPFRFVEQLYENFVSIRKSISSLIENQ